jgi:hypothetical protein
MSQHAISASQDIEYRSSCPGCGGTNLTELISLPYSDPRISSYLTQHYKTGWEPHRLEGEQYVLMLCETCALIYQKAVPANALLQDIYDVWIPPSEKENLRQRYDLDYYEYLSWQVRWLIRHFHRKPTDLNVLDFGLGWAEWASMARGYGCNTFGSELSRERIVHAQSIGIPIVEWSQIPGHDFDFINTEQVFEHLVDPLATLRHLSSGLRRGGMIKISVPDGRGALRMVAGLKSGKLFEPGGLMPIQPLEHINCFRAHSLDALAVKAGLKPIKPRLLQMYDASSGWFRPKQALKNIARPVYRHIYPRSTYAFYAKDA